MTLRLGFHYHIPAFQDEAGQLRTMGVQGCFLDSLANYCEKLVCFTHTPYSSERDLMDYVLTAENIEIVDIGPHASVPRRALKARQYTAPINMRRSDLDALLIRGPSPLLPAAAAAAKPLPIALLLVGDYLARDGGASTQPRWRETAIQLWARWNHSRQTQVAKNALTFVNSRKLYQEFEGRVPQLHETRTTTLSTSDFYERDDTCQKKPYRMLFTGRLQREKGLFEMVEALAMLVDQGEDLVLDLVGWADAKDGTLADLEKLAASKGVAERVINHGYKSIGAELSQCYRDADLFVLASTSDFEGFPRSIWEALANSLPVVATRVGSIPIFLDDRKTCVLVEPRNSKALAEAISQVLNQQQLRQTLIQNGLVLARENTLETRSKELVSKIETWLTTKGRSS